MESRLAGYGSVGTEVWKRFRVRLDDELRYCRNEAESAAGLLAKFRSAYGSTEPITCPERAPSEVTCCGLPQGTLRQEPHAAEGASEGLRLAYPRALAS